MKRFFSICLLIIILMLCFKVGSIETFAFSASRDDGVWLFPLPSSYYDNFSDWAGCPGGDKCVFCGVYHSGWGDSAHTGQGGHNGVDVAAPAGTPVYASASGIATYFYNSARGNTIIIEHQIGNGYSYYTYYQHLNAISITAGQSVNVGDTIGTVGNTGQSGGNHLHFGMLISSSGQTMNSSFLNKVEGYGWITTASGNNGRILNNPASINDAGFPKGKSAVVAPLSAHCGSVHYTFNKDKVTLSNNISNPWLKVSESGIFLGDSVTFTFGADNAVSYDITIKHHEKTIKTENNVNSGVSYTFDEEGMYYAYITAKNGSKTIDSQAISFYVVDALDMGSYFVAKIKNPVLGHYVALETSDSNVLIASETTNSNNEWKFIRQEDLSYKITNVKTGNCLGLFDSSTENCTNIGCYPSDNSDYQKWYVRKNLSGYALVSKARLSSDLSITGNGWIYDDCIFDGANISLYENDSVQSQRFSFEYIVPPINEWLVIDKTELTSREKLKFEFGADFTKKYTLHVEFRDGSILESDIKPGESLSFDKSGKIEAYIICTLEDGNTVNTEKVSFYNMKIYDFGKTFTAKIRNTASGFYVATEKNNENYQNVFISSETLCDNNIWRFDMQQDGSYKIFNIKTGGVLSLCDEKTVDKTNIVCSLDTGSDTQKWFITSNIDGYALAPKNCYTKYLSVYDNNTIWWYGTHTDGAEVLLYELDNVQSQRFVFDNYLLNSDVNCDGVLNVSDLADLKKYIAGLLSDTEMSELNPDADGNGIINVADLAELKKIIAGLV